jgi:exopolysaccharide biosynthesis polyprenyl glycosylphosphotransferase
VTVEVAPAAEVQATLAGSAVRALELPSRTVRRYRSRAVAHGLRFGISPYLLAADLAALALGTAVAGGLTGSLLVLAAATLLLNVGAGLYRSRLNLAVLDQAPTLCVRALAAAATASALGVVLVNGRDTSRLFVAAGTYCGAALVSRGVVFAAVRWVRRRGIVAHPTLVLGAGQVARQVATVLCEHPEYGLRVLGFLDSDPLLSDAERPAPLLGGEEDLAEIVARTGARQVVIAYAAWPSSSVVDIIRTCDRLDCELFIVPRLFELNHRAGRDIEVVWGLPLIRLRRAPFRHFSWRIKRVVDVVFAAAALAACAPLLAAVALLVRREGGPGVLFRQQRVGLDGRPFTLLKFRSMRPVDDGESATLWTIARDDRVGPVGRFLRRTSLDELPQLWNVLRGDMSIVGPRPERPHFVHEFANSTPRYLARHRVPCGMTGWAQVHGLRGDTSIADRARFDNYYIENWSLWLDLKIVVRTVTAVLNGEGR